MKYQRYKKGIVMISLLIIVALLFAGCGQNEADKKGQDDSMTNSTENNIEIEENPNEDENVTPAEEENINVTLVPAVPEESPKAEQQQKFPVQNNNNNTSDTAKVNNALGTSDVNPSGSTENKITTSSGGAKTSNPEELKDRMRNSTQGLVNDGTITQEQAEKIVHVFVDIAASGSGVRITPNSLSGLVEQGVITQEQADAVMNALMANSQGATNMKSSQ
ncbi:hypothetical protein SAMN05446037_102841 [Anaerovirgula multivorans]|uniref:Lipoprotein n=1 Tax=Anaerovirgula multivorans TaxID=312168 RepID=A0A239IIY5_9FIRM|nr:hypothetical protein [Anaerovirgula multivorans]SNS93587.1 hypothetical protein SAMN05446037_102841 [Anaerovirgula multivorans]